MPVADYPVHESVKLADGALWGCNNRHFSEGYWHRGVETINGLPVPTMTFIKMIDYTTFIVEYVAEVDGQQFKTNERVSARGNLDAINRVKENNKIFVRCIKVTTVK